MGVKIKKIGVGIDGSNISFKALEEGISLAQKFDAEVVAIHVLPVPRDIAELGGAITELEGELRNQAEAIIAQAESKAKEVGVKFNGVVLSGNPVDMLIEYAQKEGLDLLIVGYHGRSKLSELLMGSVTSKLLALSSVPLLVIK